MYMYIALADTLYSPLITYSVTLHFHSLFHTMSFSGVNSNTVSHVL